MCRGNTLIYCVSTCLLLCAGNKETLSDFDYLKSKVKDESRSRVVTVSTTLFIHILCLIYKTFKLRMSLLMLESKDVGAIQMYKGLFLLYSHGYNRNSSDFQAKTITKQ